MQLLAVILGWIIYAAVLFVTGALRGEDMNVVWDALPIPQVVRRRLG